MFAKLVELANVELPRAKRLLLAKVFGQFTSQEDLVEGLCVLRDNGSGVPYEFVRSMENVFFRIFRAVADPTRRSIVERLHQHELTVRELCEPFRITQPSLSKHLAVLRHSGLIAARRSGRHRYYRLEPEPLEQIAAWAAQFRDVRDPLGQPLRLRTGSICH